MIPPPPYQGDNIPSPNYTPKGCVSDTQSGGGNKKSYVYLIRSLRSGKYYIGWTTDIKRRLDEHDAGKSYHTKSRGPWELVGYEIHSTPEEAKKRERTLKHNPYMCFLFKKRLSSHHLTTHRPHHPLTNCKVGSSNQKRVVRRKCVSDTQSGGGISR